MEDAVVKLAALYILTFTFTDALYSNAQAESKDINTFKPCQKRI